MDLRKKVVEVLECHSGRILCSELIRNLEDVFSTEEASKKDFKQAVSAVAYVEHGEDQRRYLVLKDLSRGKENMSLIKSVSSQATQTPKKNNKIVLSRQPESAKPVNITRPNHLPVPRRPSYSTYTSNEPRQWWLASMDCRHVDMARLLGLNPKLVDWHNPTDGWTALHYAAKFGNTKCLRLLATQSHANVNTQNRCGQTPLHVACVYSQRIVIRMLVEEYKANTCILDFSGHYPVSLLSNELQPDFESLLTAGRLQKIRSMLEILQIGHSRTDLRSSKDLSGQNIQSDLSGEFKRPSSSVRPIRQRETMPRPAHNALPTASLSATLPSSYRPSLVKSSTILGEGLVSRRTSVLINMLHTATQMASEHERTAGTSDTPSSPSSPTSADPVSPIDVRGTTGKSNALNGDTGSTGSSSTNASISLSAATLLPSYCSTRYSLDQPELSAIPLHKLPKHSPPTADPKALSMLLSLLPPSPEQRTGSSNKSRTHKYRRALKSIARHSSASLIPPACSSPKHSHEHSRSKLSTSAIIAETDVRRLVFRSAGVGRKASTRSLNPDLPESPPAPVPTGHHLGSRGPFRSYSASHSLDCTPVC